MRIGFVGYGSMAAALASRWVGEHTVVVGGRDPGKAEKLAQELGSGTRHGTGAEAVAGADVVVLATRHDVVFDAIEACGGADAFAGKVVVDINNPVDIDGTFLAKNYDGHSLAEELQKRLAGAHVVKAFNTCQAKVWQMDPPVFDGRPLVVPIAGDDDDAKRTVAELVRALGAEPFDLGDLRYARNLEVLACTVIKLLFSGHDPHTVFNLILPERKPIG